MTILRKCANIITGMNLWRVIKMSKGCTKKRTSKDRTLSELTTFDNKIRKFTRIVKNNPNDHAAKNTLAQLKHDRLTKKR